MSPEIQTIIDEIRSNITLVMDGVMGIEDRLNARASDRSAAIEDILTERQARIENFKQEFDDNANHRLVDLTTEECSRWASYRGTTYLNGVCGYTAYWSTAEGMCLAEHLASLVSTGKADHDALTKEARPAAPAPDRE